MGVTVRVTVGVRVGVTVGVRVGVMVRVRVGVTVGSVKSLLSNISSGICEVSP